MTGVALADHPPFQTALAKRVDHASAWAYLDMERLREILRKETDSPSEHPILRGQAPNPAAELIWGGILTTLMHTQHDTGIKEILGKSGRFESKKGVQVALPHPAADPFIVSKLFRCFFCDEFDPPEDLLALLVTQFRDDELQLRPLVTRMISSRLFFLSSVAGKKIRMPLELALGWLRSLDGAANLTWLAPRLAELGQGLFFPPSVKGWEGGRAWSIQQLSSAARM
jgi:hypothetical protein